MGGRLIVFEGVEGSGKTSQIFLIQEWLRRISDCPVVVTREPGGTNLGQQLRQILLHGEQVNGQAELCLYTADRIQHVEEVIKPHLRAGAIILCDRFTASTVAYQGYGRGLSLELINQLNALATAGLPTHLTLWLDVEVTVGLKRAKRRGKFDRIETDSIEFHRRVQIGYQAQAEANPEVFCRIDAGQSLQQVNNTIQNILAQYLHLQIPGSV